MPTLSLSSTVRLSSGHTMPLLGFGVYKNFTTKESCLEAFKAGYRHVDTAQAYRNEDAVGAAARESGLQRADFFIATKCATKSHGYQSTLKGVDDSLARFQFDYIDLFLIHDPYSGTERRLATYKALQEAKQAGKIRDVGVSNFGLKHLEEIRAAGFPMPSVNQIEIQPFCQQRAIVSYCREHNVVVQAYAPLMRGRLYHPTIIELATKVREPWFIAFLVGLIQYTPSSLVKKSISIQYDRDPAQIVLRWSLQNHFVPLPKSATPARIHSNTQLYDFELTEEDMSKLDSLDRGKEGAICWYPVEAD